MPYFSETSKARLATCHWKLRKIFEEVIKSYDIAILCGYRDALEQNTAYEAGKSRVRYPYSAHNQRPAMAVDVCPHPLDWDDIGGFYYLAGYVRRVSDEMGIPLRYGGNWDCDAEFDDERLRDLVHYELLPPKIR